jgi:hypothetical protein
MAEMTAAITGSLLVCDAWFDVLTSRGSSDIAQAIASALLIELPLAGLCFWMARNVAHAVEVARPFLQAAGFTIADNKLVPPPESATPGRPKTTGFQDSMAPPRRDDRPDDRQQGRSGI